MLRSEFDTLSKSSNRPSDEEYELIEFVYNWHPCNFSKENVAAFYDAYGMTLFYDMEERSKAAMERDLKIRDIENEINRLKNLKYVLANNKLDYRLEDEE